MTFCANRNNIKTMVTVVPVWMVILFCQSRTYSANKSSGGWNSFGFDSGMYFVICFLSFWMQESLSLCRVSLIGFSRFCLPILFSVSLAFICFFILFEISDSFCRVFAIPFSIFSAFLCFFVQPLILVFARMASISSFSKFGRGFNFFAFRALFCYGWIRHGFFLTKKLRLEPLWGHSPHGLFYYMINYTVCQGKF